MDSHNKKYVHDNADDSVTFMISFCKETSRLIFEISEESKRRAEQSTFKALCIKILRLLFNFVHRITLKLGLKPLIKKSGFYRFLIKKGIIDKLSGKTPR